MNLLERNLAFNLGGHVDHSVFWPNISPDGGDKLARPAKGLGESQAGTLPSRGLVGFLDTGWPAPLRPLTSQQTFSARFSTLCTEYVTYCIYTPRIA